RRGGHQHLSRQEEADSLGFSRSRVGGLRDPAPPLPAEEAVPAVHDDEPHHAPAAGRTGLTSDHPEEMTMKLMRNTLAAAALLGAQALLFPVHADAAAAGPCKLEIT